MKILYVGHTYTVRANQAKIAALARQPGVKITLVTPHAWKGPLYENQTDLFDSSIAPHVDHKIVRAYGIGKEGAYFFSPKIFSIIAKVRPDVVHVEQGAYAVVYTQILLALKLFSPDSRALFFTWWNLPYEPRGLKRWTERFNLKHSAAAIAGNAAAKEILRTHGFSGPVSVLPQLGIDIPADIRTPSRHEVFMVGYAGRISMEKGVLDLVRAVAQMEQAKKRLYFIGNGDILSDVKREAAYLGVELEHRAAVRNDELIEHFSKMDVLVLPSRSTPQWVEQFGHILLEAMAAGLPVVGSSSGEIPNVIGEAGLVFEEGNIAELTGVLDRLATNEEKRQELAGLGYKRIKSFFTHDLIAQKQVELYNSILQHSSVGVEATRTLEGELAG
jgi:glycosyltransferase involved in cell wall biosynthesis